MCFRLVAVVYDCSAANYMYVPHHMCICFKYVAVFDCSAACLQLGYVCVKNDTENNSMCIYVCVCVRMCGCVYSHMCMCVCICMCVYNVAYAYITTCIWVMCVSKAKV